jgi:hypothetical protein
MDPRPCPIRPEARSAKSCPGPIDTSRCVRGDVIKRTSPETATVRMSRFSGHSDRPASPSASLASRQLMPSSRVYLTPLAIQSRISAPYRRRGLGHIRPDWPEAAAPHCHRPLLLQRSRRLARSDRAFQDVARRGHTAYQPAWWAKKRVAASIRMARSTSRATMWNDLSSQRRSITWLPRLPVSSSESSIGTV